MPSARLRKSPARAAKTAKKIDVADFKTAYPRLDPDKEYPPLRFKSQKGKVSAAEWEARVDCAAAYRLVQIFGMHDLTYNHVSVRIPGTEHFLLNPYGMMYDEICASSLIKVDIDGNVLWSPDWPKGLSYGVNLAGFVIHSAVHKARAEIGCVIHTHSLATMAVSSLEEGLIPLTQTAMRWATVGYHDYEGPAIRMEEQQRLVAHLADNDILFLRNHGVLAVGETVGQAFNNTYRVERACQSQLLALSCNARLIRPAKDVIDRTTNAYHPKTRRPYGVLEWPAMRRLADRVDPSYRK